MLSRVVFIISIGLFPVVLPQYTNFEKQPITITKNLLNISENAFSYNFVKNKLINFQAQTDADKCTRGFFELILNADANTLQCK